MLASKVFILSTKLNTLDPHFCPLSFGTCKRYGPGLVIYWFGFVETLVSQNFDGFKKDIMVTADFPSPIMLPDGQVL